MTRRLRFNDKSARALDSAGSYQAQSGTDVRRILQEGEASAALFAAANQTSSEHEALRMIEEAKRSMEEFKAESARRWGSRSGERVAAQDRANDATLSPMERFKAASAARHGAR